MPHVKLTDLAIEKLKPSKSQITYWDVALPIGFGIRLGARRKTFILIDSSGKRIKLGLYPHTTLAEARAKALDTRHGPKNDLHQGPPLSQSVSDYIRSHTGSPRWIKEQHRLLTKHLLSRHPTASAAEITTTDILKITDALKDTKSEQLHAFRAIKALYSWLLRRKLIRSSPLESLPLPAKETKRSRVLSYEELKKIWHATEQPTPFNIVLRLCLLTGQRKGEISMSPVPPSTASTFTIPASLAKNKTEHSLPLSARSLALLRSLSAPNRTWSKPKKNLDELSGVRGWTIHDLRRTFATNLAELQVEPHIIERLLNHSTGAISGVAAIYNRFHFMPQMTAALERYENELVKRGVIT